MAPYSSISMRTYLMYAASARMHFGTNSPEACSSPISSTRGASRPGDVGRTRATRMGDSPREAATGAGSIPPGQSDQNTGSSSPGGPDQGIRAQPNHRGGTGPPTE